MALDGIILEKCANELRSRLPMRINRINESSNTTLVFNVHGARERQNLIISLHSNFNRICLSERNYQSNSQPSGFVMLLRKYLLNGIIVKIEQRCLDRYLLLHIHARDELYDERHFLLSVELMGKYANLILVDEDTGKIIDALKRIPPYENSQRTVLAGVPFSPVSPQEKVDPYKLKNTPNMEESLVKQLAGFSKLLETEFRYRLHHGEDFFTLLHQLENARNLYVSTYQDTYEYHVIPLTHLKTSWQEFPLFEGMEYVYFEQEEKNRLKEVSGDLFRFIKRQQKHYNLKYQKLQLSYQESLQLDDELEAGNLLYTYANLNQKGLTECQVEDNEGNKKIISLNPRFSVKDNARKYFQNYQKKRKGQKYIQEQLELTRYEIQYFNALAEQILFANNEELQQIRDELTTGGYWRVKKENKQKNKKKTKKIRVYQLNFKGQRILFGKNNLQNEQVSFKLAHGNDTWFHAKDYHGAHVIVNNEKPDEDTIRLCANLAAYYSQGRYSSSVPVDYTVAKNIKKIKGTKPGFVSISHQKTIYIDPEEKKDLLILPF